MYVGLVGIDSERSLGEFDDAGGKMPRIPRCRRPDSARLRDVWLGRAAGFFR